MVHARPGQRFKDTVFVLVAVLLICSPLALSAWAASSSSVTTPIIAHPIGVTQEVKQSASVVIPVRGDFDLDTSGGTSRGTLYWDVFTTANEGFKLSLHTTRSPAMWDTSKGRGLSDYPSKPSKWNVTGNDNMFGFSAAGPEALSKYKQGTMWRGFSGDNPIEVSRRREGAAGLTTTEVNVAAEINSSISGTTPRAYMVGTVTINLA